jgi:hypothetical protein
MTDADNSSAALLKMALRGSEDTWVRLQELCRDRMTAESLARALEQTGDPVADDVRSWAHFLEELHPGLKVKLAPA